MKKIYIANILIFLSAFTTVLSADAPSTASSSSAAAATDATTTIDPTLLFFSALSTCTPGSYTEKNILTTEVGQPLLNQQIIGPSDDKLTCNVKLMTPDNRTMDCAFPMGDLAKFNDQNFLQGMLQDTTDSPEQNSLNADVSWSQMKADNCSLND